MHYAKLAGLLACVTLVVSGCAGSPATSQKPTGKNMQSTHPNATFLALGDSYTIGESVASNQRWPVQLVRALRHQGFRVDAPKLVAETGWTTDELSSAMDDADLHPPYDLVSLGIGVNDQYRGRDPQSAARGFENLLERVITLAGGKPGNVIVLSIPDWGVTPFARKDERSPGEIAGQIDTYNRLEHDITEKHGARWVDVTDASRRVADDIMLVANDGLHPSPQQYRAWVSRILPVAEDILRPGFGGDGG